MAVSTDGQRSGSGFQLGHQVFGLCDLAELFESLRFDLPHAFLRDSQSGTHLLERLRLVLVVEPIAANDDRLLSRVEPIEKLLHLMQPIPFGNPLPVLIGTGVGCCLQQFRVGCPKPLPLLMLIGNRAGVVLRR